MNPRFWTRSRVLWTAVTALLLLHATLAWQARSPAILTEGDDARYFLLAESLRDLRYVEMWEIGDPPHRDYPPVYPAVLSLWGAVHGDQYDLFLLLNIAASVAGLGALFVVLRWLGLPSVGLLCLLVLAVNPKLVSIAGVLRPESLYMALSVVSLALLARRSASTADRTLGCTAGIFAALTRPLGMALLPAIGLHWLQERRFRAAGWLGLCSAVTVAPWLYYSLLASGDGPAGVYASDLGLAIEPQTGSVVSQLLARIARHVPKYLASEVPQNLALPFAPGTVIDNLVIGGGVAFFCLVGMIRLYREWRPAAYYLLAYGGILALWPWYSSRFVIPLLPFLVAAILLGVRAVADAVSNRLVVPAALALALILAGFGSLTSLDLVARASRCERGPMPPGAACLDTDSQSFFEALAFVNRELPPEAVLFSGRPAALYLYTGRKTLNRNRAFNIVQDDSLGVDRLAAAGLTHILLGHVKNLEPRMAAALVQRCVDLTLLGEFGARTLLLGVEAARKRVDTQTADDAACRALEGYLIATTDPGTGEPRLDFRRTWPPPSE